MVGHIHRGKSGLVGARFVIATALIVGLFIALMSGFGSTKAQAQTQAQAQARSFALGSVVAATVNTALRDQPADSPAIAQMPTNARAIVIGGVFNDGWYWLDYNGTQGYVQGKSLALVDDKYTPVPEQTATPTSTKVPPTPKVTSTPVPPTATTIPSATPTPDGSIPTTAGVYTGLWVGEMESAGNVRSGPGLDQKVIKGWWVGRRVILYQQVKDSKGATWYRVSDPPEDPMYVHSSLVRKVMPVAYEAAKFKGKWVNVNITQQVVTGYVDGTPVKVTLASTGKNDNKTDLGVWKVYWRLPKQDMGGGNKASGDYYKLKDVQWVQYFHTTGEALHGTFWHDNFGYPMSHGCVNLSTPIAQWFYEWGYVGLIVYTHN